MPGDRIACVTGWYGKLPARGDFISRRLPGIFVRRWDAWLQSGIRTGSERLASRWLDCYSRAPVWRFLLAPGLVTREALAGVLMPSADRVGRLFPLTIAAVLDAGSVDLAKTLLEADAWFATLEAAARAGLDPALDVEIYDERISALAFPAGSLVALKPASEPHRNKPAETTGARAFHTPLGIGQDQPMEMSIARLLAQFDGDTEQRALWLTRSSKVFGEWALASAGLPQGEQFCAMLDGDWQGHGWS